MNLLSSLSSISKSNADHYKQHQTEVTLLLNDFLLRYLNTIYTEFNGDITLAIVLGEIAHHMVALHVRQGRLVPDTTVDKTRENVRDKVKILACNPFSISEATGIPRETVRRKFSELEQMGYVDRISPRSYIMNMKVSERFIPDFNLRLFEEFRTLCTQMNDVLKIETGCR